jgi:hypothetical protein
MSNCPSPHACKLVSSPSYRIRELSLILAMAAVAAPLSVVAGFRGAAASSFQPLQPRARPVAVRASMKEKVSAGLTAAGVATALVMPDVADAVAEELPAQHRVRRGGARGHRRRRLQLRPRQADLRHAYVGRLVCMVYRWQLLLCYFQTDLWYGMEFGVNPCLFWLCSDALLPCTSINCAKEPAVCETYSQ